MRTVGWTDRSIKAGFGGPDRERQYRGKKGEKHIVRLMTECGEYRVHKVDDVLEPKEDGKERAFNMICSREWDDEEGDYLGDCEGCDRDYEVSLRYACGLLLLAVIKGRGKPQKIDPENACYWWDFGKDKYRKISDLALELGELSKPKKLRDKEMIISCEDEEWQKLDINVSQRDNLTTRAHVKIWKEEGQELLDEAVKPDDLKSQKRRLKKKKSKKKSGDEEPKKKGARRKPKKKEEEQDDEPESTGDDELDDLLDDLED